MLALFVAAFDDCFLYRYTKDRVSKEKISVRYEHGPKERTLLSLVDKAQTLTLPVVTIDQQSLARDPARVRNKDQYMYRPHSSDKNVARIPMPIPVNLGVNVSIICQFKEDLDQIVSNFVPYMNPYLEVSWKVPPEFGMDFVDEVRLEIEWDGTVNYETPKIVTNDVQWRIIGNTSFTIKGFLYKSDVNPQATIYTVRSDFHSVNLLERNPVYEDFNSLSANSSNETDVILISAFPEITNYYYNLSGSTIPALSTVTVFSYNNNSFILYGKRFGYNNNFYLSSGTSNFYNNFELISTIKYPLISGYRLQDSEFQVYNDNIAVINLSANSLLSAGNFTIVTSNEAGWVATPHIISNSL